MKKQVRGGRFQFEVATREDDAELRELLRETSMGGAVTVTMRREPSYFAAAAVDGPDCHVLTVRDVETGRLVGMGASSVRMRYLKGRAEPVGYLSGLRILPNYRSFGLLSRGYRALREFGLVAGADFYLTTIAEGNQRAIDVLTSGRGGLPRYVYLGRYYTCALPLRPRRKESNETGIDVRPASQRDLASLVRHVQGIGQQLNCCPRYEEEDFFRGECTFANLRPEDIVLAFRNDEIVGSLGVWDQLPFRQLVVEGYSPIQGLVRPLYNAWAQLRGGPCFPAAGQPSRHLIAAVPLIRQSDPRIALAMLDHVRRRTNRSRYDSFMFGVYEQDSLRRWIESESVFTYVTRVYLVSWDDDAARLEQLRSQNLYLELGCL